MMRLFASVIFLISLVSCQRSLPSEASLIKRFEDNKNDFQTLVSMLNEDADIRRLSNENVFYIEPGEQTISEERVSEYRQLLRKLRIEDGIHRDDPHLIRIIASSCRIPVVACSKSYAYSTKTPEPLVESIDDFVSYRTQTPVYKKLDDKWYLEYESW